jgi:RNA polymerase sigma-70 factor, ECF subfamily
LRERSSVFRDLLSDPSVENLITDGVLDHETIRDDQLRLIFTCCHPALAPEQRIALALRTIAGLKTSEIATAFLVSQATMGQRISRAKAKIATARIPYRVPDAHELPDRLSSVLRVVVSIFTAGHHANAGEMQSRIDLCDEAIRLARHLSSLMPDEAECAGALALLLATHARRAARSDAAGDTILMANQDRSKWDHEAIGEASVLVEQTLRRGNAGPMQIQAAIACLHGLAPTYDATDWPQIAELYRMLERREPTVVVRVNRQLLCA